MRFEYKPPTPNLIVSDGKTVAVENSRLKTVDRYSLSDTPLEIILGDKIDLLNDHSITGVEHQQDALIVHARSRGSNAQGNISLVFAAPNLELRQWTVVDNQGLQTTVALRDVQIGADVSHVQFTVPPKN
jgi:outer membrane lipoprotein-sorting protein